MKKVFVSAIIAAAGDGVRMGGVCKGLLTLSGTSLFEYVLKAFTNCDDIDEVICVCKDEPEFAAIAERCKGKKPIKLVRGGDRRYESVYLGQSDADRRSRCLCIHDCARPFVTPELISKTINAALSTGGCACVSSHVTDTVKFIADNGVKTPNRSKLFAVQTPQVFLRDIYVASYALSKKKGLEPTDETTMAEYAGFKVEYVDSDTMNMKITTPSDLLLAQAYAEIINKSNA